MDSVRHVGKVLFALFLCYHLAATWANLIPSGSKLRQVARSIFWHYQCASGTQQDWNMFVAIARHRHSDLKVIFRDRNEETVAREPLLPNFALYDIPRTFRHHTLISRIWFSESPQLLEVLGQKYFQAAQQEGRIPVASLDSIELEFYYEEINPLVFMQVGGDVAFPHTLRRRLWVAEE